MSTPTLPSTVERDLVTRHDVAYWRTEDLLGQGTPEQWDRTPYWPRVNEVAKRAIEESIDLSNLTPVQKIDSGIFSAAEHPTHTVFAFLQERMATLRGNRPSQNESANKPNPPVNLDLLNTLLQQLEGGHDHQYQRGETMDWLSHTKVGAVVKTPITRRPVMAITNACNVLPHHDGSVRVGSGPIHVVPSDGIIVGNTMHVVRIRGRSQIEKLQRVNGVHVYSS